MSSPVRDDRESWAAWIVVVRDWVGGDAAVVHADESVFGVMVDGVRDGAVFGLGGPLDMFDYVVDVSGTVIHQEGVDQVAGAVSAP